MIEKVKGSPKIDKLRVIHLYEADYNIVQKIVWARKSVWQAHNLGRLHEGQAGSRPNQRAFDVVIQKEMKYEYARLTRTNLGTIDNDAKSCFDRIICNLAMLVSRYYGVPNNFCKTQATTLQNTIFKLRTALGDSKQTYKHSTKTPIHGTGQGSCASPAIWLMISSILMNILQQNAFGMKMVDVQTYQEAICQIIEGFVDDTSIFTNDDELTINSIREKLQSDGTWWAGLLESAGGKLELKKCFYYLLSWKWDSKGNPIPESSEEQSQGNNETVICLNKDCKNPINLTQKETYQSHKTLGAYKCLVGEENDHIKFLEQKSNNLAKLTMSSQFNRRQTRKAFNSCYIPAIIYSLTACNLEETHLDKIQQQATTAYIRKCGYEMHFPRKVVYTPIKPRRVRI
jgi:Reverse transcriptase (RNA-dependent DNA polymerase)